MKKKRETTPVSIEVVTHKRATKRQVEKVNKANRELNELFEDNHFTVKLVLASKT